MRDFSGGQLNTASLRSDESPQYRTGARVMSNWLCETTGTLVPRPGRRLLAATGAPREEYARVGSTDFGIAFGVDALGHGQITIYDLGSAAIVAQQSSNTYLWSLLTVDQIYFCVCDFQIVVCFPGMRPQLCIRTPSTGAWTFGQFAFRTITSQSQQPFVRSTVLGATMTYDNNAAGPVNLMCSAPYFTPNMVGRYLSILGQQVQITGVSSPTTAKGTILNRLPDFVVLAVDKLAPFQAGQIAQVTGQAGSLTIEIDEVDAFNSPTVDGQYTPTRAQIFGVVTSSVVNSYPFTYGDVLVTEMGSANINGTLTFSSGFTVQWLEQFMGDGIGWPMACAYDRGRLIFFDFPQKPEAILWSAIGAYDVFWVDSAAANLQAAAGASPTSAIFEYIPGGPRVRHVIGWGDELVFTDKGLYEIPISASGNPLQPGSVEFRQFSNDGVSPVVPIKTIDSIVYINAGGKRASLVIRTGAYSNIYTSDGASELYTDLFTGPIAMLVAQGDGQVPERLVYVLNADGSVVIGRFTADRKFVGWQPWTSALSPSWIFCNGPTVYYCLPLAGTSWLAAEDGSLFLDAAIAPNMPAVNFPPPPAGKGLFWPFAGQTITAMNGAADLGDIAIDANGNPPAGFDASPIGLVAGLLYTPELTPFVPMTPAGESMGQRQHRRHISRQMATTEMSSGYTMGAWTFPAAGRDPDVQQVRPLGRDYDPACPLVKARPGPLRIVEVSTECTI